MGLPFCHMIGEVARERDSLRLNHLAERDGQESNPLPLADADTMVAALPLSYRPVQVGPRGLATGRSPTASSPVSM